MANEDKKDFNAMLHDSKDMPKMQILQNRLQWEFCFHCGLGKLSAF